MNSLLLHARRAAFSLMELLVVIAIIGIIAVFVIPAATTIIMGSDITRASQAISGSFSLARQVASTKNHAVEVRMIRFPDVEQPGEKLDDPDTWNFRAIQLMEVFENGNMAQVGKFERLPGNIIMDPGIYSSLLDKTSTAEDGQQPPTLVEVQNSTRKDFPPLPRVADADARRYQYRCFRYLPDGSTNLSPQGKWYVTVYARENREKAAAVTVKAPPTFNYFTMQVDPASGSTRTFRPTAGKKETGGGGISK